MNINYLGRFDDTAVVAEPFYGIRYQACWGWANPVDNREYGILGSTAGTYIIDVTDPANPTQSDYVAGRQNDYIWHEYKTYGNALYIISDDGGLNSFQIADLSYLPDSVHVVYDSTDIFVHAHTLFIDGNKLYVGSVSTGFGFSSMNVYSLNDPLHPTLLRRLDQDYPFINHVHDMFVSNDTIYASCGYDGLFIFRYDSIANQFIQLGAQPGSGYNHSSFLSPDHSILYVCKEVPAGQPVQVVNVSDIYNPTLVGTFYSNIGATPHNPYVEGNNLFIAYYQDGVYVYDISNPVSPVLSGYFDTFMANPPGTYLQPAYAGCWSVYTALPSGVLLAGDMQSGLFCLDISAITLVCSAATTGAIHCPNTDFTVTAHHTGGDAPYSYAWSDGNGGIYPNASTITANLPAGTYNFVCTVTDDFSATCNSSITIKVNPNPTIAVSPTSAQICNPTPNAITLTASGGSTYVWTPGAGLYTTVGSSVEANPLSNTSYIVTGTDANGCVNTASTSITVGYTPYNVTASATPSTICPGTFSQLSSTADCMNHKLTVGVWSGHAFVVQGNEAGVKRKLPAAHNYSTDWRNSDISQLMTLGTYDNIYSTSTNCNLTYSWQPSAGLTPDAFSENPVATGVNSSTIYTVTITDNGCSVTATASVIASIDDGNACTTDGCNTVSGTPMHTPVDVDDGDPCTADGCNSVTGVFHTPICNVTLNSSIFLQGYYTGGGLMDNSGAGGYMFVSGFAFIPPAAVTDVDFVTISAMDPTFPYALVDAQTARLQANGNISVTFNTSVIPGNSYYLKVNHQVSVETWSAAPVVLSGVVNYLFSTSATQAFASNQAITPDNVYAAIFTGDINQDGAVDGSDFLILDPEILNGNGGYTAFDLNGDGAVDGSDFLVLDPNIENGIGVATP